MLPARELVRPNMRRSVAFPAPQALVGIDMQRIFAFFAAQVAAGRGEGSAPPASGPGLLGARPAAGGFATWRLALGVVGLGQPNSRDETAQLTQLSAQAGPQKARAGARSDNVPPTRQGGLLTMLLPNVLSRCVMGLRLATPLVGQ
jgi:hypothetical protein